jgi:hypothetical protein
VRAHALEQLFVARRAGRIELRLVLVDPAEGRTRVTHRPPTADEGEAVAWLATHLAREGEVSDLRRLRVRVERGGGLVDAPELAERFIAAFRRGRGATEAP